MCVVCGAMAEEHNAVCTTECRECGDNFCQGHAGFADIDDEVRTLAGCHTHVKLGEVKP